MAFYDFSYNITRPYPYKWFTAVVLLGGSVSIVLFSWINFALNGYYLSIEYTENPNATITKYQHDSYFPLRRFSKIKASCEDQLFPVKSVFYTDKLGLSYTLTNISDPGPAATLVYHNGRLNNCTIKYIQVSLEAEDRTAIQFGWQQYGPKAKVSAECDVESRQGRVAINLITEYDYLPPEIGQGEGYMKLLKPDQKEKAALWWGGSLLSTYWKHLASELQIIRKNDESEGKPLIRKGYISFVPHPSVEDIKSLSFLDLVDYHFVREDYYILALENDQRPTLEDLIDEKRYPDIWFAADRFAKSAYSVVLADLGQASLPNILTDPAALEFYTADFPDYQALIEDGGDEGNAVTGPARDSYTRDSTAKLEITGSVLFTKYLCQVPKIKSVASLVYSILIADLVLLQALWKIFTMAVTAFLTRKDPKANECLGAHGGDDAVPTPVSNVSNGDAVENVEMDRLLQGNRGNHQ